MREHPRAFGSLTLCLNCLKGRKAEDFLPSKHEFRGLSKHCLACQRELKITNAAAGMAAMAKQRKEQNVRRIVDSIVGIQAGVPSANEILSKLIEKFEGVDGFVNEMFADIQAMRSKPAAQRSDKVVMDTWNRLVGMVQSANQQNLVAAKLLTDAQLENELQKALTIYTEAEEADQPKLEDHRETA